jgi:hypothetical protein
VVWPTAGVREEGRLGVGSGRGLDRIFRAVAFALDHDGIGVMQNSVKVGDRDAGS